MAHRKKLGGETMEKTTEETAKMNNYPGLAFHGTTFNDYYRPKKVTMRPGKGNHKKKMIKVFESEVASWVKQLFLIDSWIRNKQNDNRPYFVSTVGVMETLKGYGNDYSLRTIQKNLHKLEDMGFIKIVPFPASEEELKVNPNNKHLHRRKLLPDIDKINEYISVFDEDDKILKNLPDRDPRKKLIRQRPYSYVGEHEEIIESKYKEYTEAKDGLTRRKPYRNPKELLIYWARKVSSKYYNVDGLTKKFIPTSLDNQQEVVDKASISKASPKGIIDEYMVRCYQDNIDDMDDSEAYSLIGWKAPPQEDQIKRLEEIGYEIKNGFIKAFKRPKKKEVNTSYKKPTERQRQAFKAFINAI